MPLPGGWVNSVGCRQSVLRERIGRLHDGGDFWMAGVDDLDGVLQRFKQAGNEFVRGNPKPVQELFLPPRRRDPSQPLRPSCAWMGAGC
jgi:hypothetical protein